LSAETESIATQDVPSGAGAGSQGKGHTRQTGLRCLAAAVGMEPAQGRVHLDTARRRLRQGGLAIGARVAQVVPDRPFD